MQNKMKKSKRQTDKTDSIAKLKSAKPGNHA
jgi:hypothetical protein